MSHPELNPTCMSCGRSLDPTTLFGIPYSVRHRVPEDVDCCSRCWSKVPVHERIKIVISVRDRELGGILNLISAMGEQAILEQRTGK